MVELHPTYSQIIVMINLTPQIIVMVGLPARGKTYIGTKLARYNNTVVIGDPRVPTIPGVGSS